MTFFIHGDPKGQPRARAFARKMGAKYVARVYDSDVADEWKRAVDQAIRKAFVEYRPQFEGHVPFEVVATFNMRRPKSHFNAQQEVKIVAPMRHTQKPDCDNLIKLVLDRITQSELFWRDDSQVAYLTVAKYWVDNEKRIGCNLTLQPLTMT